MGTTSSTPHKSCEEQTIAVVIAVRFAVIKTISNVDTGSRNVAQVASKEAVCENGEEFHQSQEWQDEYLQGDNWSRHDWLHEEQEQEQTQGQYAEKDMEIGVDYETTHICEYQPFSSTTVCSEDGCSNKPQEVESSHLLHENVERKVKVIPTKVTVEDKPSI